MLTGITLPGQNSEQQQKKTGIKSPLRGNSETEGKNFFHYYKSHLKGKNRQEVCFNDWHIMIVCSTKLQKMAHDVTGAPCLGFL